MLPTAAFNHLPWTVGFRVPGPVGFSSRMGECPSGIDVAVAARYAEPSSGGGSPRTVGHHGIRMRPSPSSTGWPRPNNPVAAPSRHLFNNDSAGTTAACCTVGYSNWMRYIPLCA